MTSKVAAAEDALIQKIKTTMEARVSIVDWAPSDWDEDFIKRLTPQLPAVFVIFGGAPRDRQSSEHALLVNSQWSVVAVTYNARGSKASARGDGREIGAYDIIEVLAPALDGFVIDDVGFFTVEAWINDASTKLESKALMIQSLNLTLPLDLSAEPDLSSLAPFRIYHDTFDIGQKPGAPPIEDTIELPQ